MLPRRDAGDRLAEIRQVLGCLSMQAAEHHDACRRSGSVTAAVVRLVHAQRSTSDHHDVACKVVLASQRHAIVTPLLKKAGTDSADMANFRPVSNLSFMSKVVERAVANQLTVPVRQQPASLLPVSLSQEALN